MSCITWHFWLGPRADGIGGTSTRHSRSKWASNVGGAMTFGTLVTFFRGRPSFLTHVALALELPRFGGQVSVAMSSPPVARS